MEAIEARNLKPGDRLRINKEYPVCGTVEEITKAGVRVLWDDWTFYSDFHAFHGMTAIDKIEPPPARGGEG